MYYFHVINLHRPVAHVNFNKSKIEPISIVNGEYTHKYIENLFSCQYKSLYSSVTSD